MQVPSQISDHFCSTQERILESDLPGAQSMALAGAPSQSDRSVSTAPTAEPTRLSDLRPRLRRWTRQPDVTTLLPQSSSKQRFGLVRQRPRLASQKQAASLQRLKLARQ